MWTGSHRHTNAHRQKKMSSLLIWCPYLQNVYILLNHLKDFPKSIFHLTEIINLFCALKARFQNFTGGQFLNSLFSLHHARLEFICRVHIFLLLELTPTDLKDKSNLQC